MIEKNKRILNLIVKAAEQSKYKISYYNCDHEEYTKLNNALYDENADIVNKAEQTLDSYLQQDFLTIKIEEEDCFDGSDEYSNYNDKTNKFEAVSNGNGEEFLTIESCYIEDPVNLYGENISFEIEKDELLDLYKKSDEEIIKIFKDRFQEQLEEFSEYMFDY